MLHIELVPAEIKHLASEITKFTSIIRADLTSGTVKAAEAYAASIVPEVDPLYKAVLELCDKVISTCTLIQAKDWRGVEARLAMLVTEITALRHGNHHGIGKYFEWCQVVINWLIGKDAPSATTDPLAHQQV